MTATRNATHTPGFIEDHEAVMAALLEELPLEAGEVRVFGRVHQTPRLMSWHGDAAYEFSGTAYEGNGWTPTLAAIRDRLEAATGVRFNSVLANLYRDGSDSVAWHADDEPELGPSDDDVRIASISLGARRRFVIKANEGGEKTEWNLGEGDLLEMRGDLQRTHKHAIPKTKKAVGPRLNLTFRVVR